jgi:hypothetical protein
MNLRAALEDQQVRWAMRNGISLGAPPNRPTSKVLSYVQRLDDNLFEPIEDSIKGQFVAGKGGELDPPDGQSGNMYAVYSSSALCLNLFHHWLRPNTPNSKPPIDGLLTAFQLPRTSVSKIEFEVPNEVNPHFKTPPHLDVQISFCDGPWKYAGIEAKFCEPYGTSEPCGLMPVYLRQKNLWRDWPNLFHFAQRLCPSDRTHLHLHAAQLIKHLLGLRNQCGARFVLVYLWFDPPCEKDAISHRREIEHFGEVLRSDGIQFLFPSYQEVFANLREDGREQLGPYKKYFLDRYLECVV